MGVGVGTDAFEVTSACDFPGFMVCKYNYLININRVIKGHDTWG